MKKQTVTELIHSIDIGNGDQCPVTFKDLPKDLQPDDIIHIIRDEGYQSENNSWDAFTRLEIFREREETNEEMEKRLKEANEFAQELKERRRQTYEKLKAEFEPTK